MDIVSTYQYDDSYNDYFEREPFCVLVRAKDQSELHVIHCNIFDHSHHCTSKIIDIHTPHIHTHAHNTHTIYHVCTLRCSVCVVCVSARSCMRTSVFTRVCCIWTPRAAIPEFFLVGIHTHPYDAFNEINSLVEVYEKAVFQFGHNQNGIILGDFNAGCSYLSHTKEEKLLLRNDPWFTWLIERDTKTTLGNSDCAYDRCISGSVKTALCADYS